MKLIGNDTTSQQQSTGEVSLHIHLKQLKAAEWPPLAVPELCHDAAAHEA
jgi:hypothetical protein